MVFVVDVAQQDVLCEKSVIDWLVVYSMPSSAIDGLQFKSRRK